MFIETNRYGLKDRKWSKSSQNTSAIRMSSKKAKMTKMLRLIQKRGKI